MLYLIIHISCILLFFQFMRYVQQRDEHVLPLISVNYIIAAAVPLLCLWVEGSGLFDVSAKIIYLGAMVGILYLMHILIMFVCIRKAGVGISATLASISSVSPVFIAWLVWSDAIDAWQ